MMTVIPEKAIVIQLFIYYLSANLSVQLFIEPEEIHWVVF